MTDEESVGLDPANKPDHLVYDYFKWITTLSLLTLGGVLSLSQSADIKLSNLDILQLLLPLCLAGIIGLSGADGVVRQATTGVAPRWKPIHALRAAVASLGIGLGVFLSIFWDTLK